MPAKSTVERAKEDLREGKSPTTAAGEFVHEEIEHRAPKEILVELAKLEAEIQQGMKGLEAML